TLEIYNGSVIAVEVDEPTSNWPTGSQLAIFSPFLLFLDLDVFGF
ncbi:23921_t:CDS:1, partial [Gigaspora margarita]